MDVIYCPRVRGVYRFSFDEFVNSIIFSSKTLTGIELSCSSTKGKNRAMLLRIELVLFWYGTELVPWMPANDVDQAQVTRMVIVKNHAVLMLD